MRHYTFRHWAAALPHTGGHQKGGGGTGALGEPRDGGEWSKKECGEGRETGETRGGGSGGGVEEGSRDGGGKAADVKRRLSTLEDLFQSGFISQAEFDSRRAAIIDSI